MKSAFTLASLGSASVPAFCLARSSRAASTARAYASACFDAMPTMSFSCRLAMSSVATSLSRLRMNGARMVFTLAARAAACASRVASGRPSSPSSASAPSRVNRGDEMDEALEFQKVVLQRRPGQQHPPPRLGRHRVQGAARRRAIFTRCASSSTRCEYFRVRSHCRWVFCSAESRSKSE